MVLFFGVDVCIFMQELIIDNVGIVFQEMYLFYVIICENLCYVKLDVIDEELVVVCMVVNIYYIIVGFEEGYDIVVGECGYCFFGGEKQCIVIVCVLLKDLLVFLLDEVILVFDMVLECVV